MRAKPTACSPACLWHLAALALVFANRLAAQHTWTVDLDNRPGTDFTDLPAAVTAAAPGDIVHLRTPSGGQYLAPTPPFVSFSKPIQIVGDVLPTRPMVAGEWYWTPVQPGASLTIANLDLRSGGYQFASFVIAAIGGRGTLIVDNVVFSITNSIASPLAGVLIRDQALASLSHCSLDLMAGVYAENSVLMVDGSYIKSSNGVASGTGGAAAIRGVQSKVLVSGSTLIGASAVAANPLNAWPAFDGCGSEFTFSGGCTLRAGSYLGGGPTAVSFVWCFAPFGGVNHAAIDPGTVLTGPLDPDPRDFIYDLGPQTGMSYQVTPTTLRIDQFTHPQSVTVLAIGAQAATPWTNLIGPVIIDPVGASEYWAPAVSGTVVHTFPIPAGLPFGYSAAVQCFELQPGGVLRTSNGAIVGIRQ